MKKPFNINNYIKVKLTDYGIKANTEHYEKYLGMSKLKFKCTPDIDKDGFTKYQMWEFMNIFGEYMRLGEDAVIEKNLIYFEN